MYAIHSVFILKENILFLEEWIDYHIQLGFNKFYLYDNSKVNKSGGCHIKHKCFTPGKVNKYNINYDELINLTDEELYNKFNKIINKYKCINVIEWSPKDTSGVVLFNQPEAHMHCLTRLKNDTIQWCANIDMDEYIVLKNHSTIQDYINSLNTNVSCIYMSQKRFDSRFNNIGKPVTSINLIEQSQLPLNHSNKCIYKINTTECMRIHSWKGSGAELKHDLNNIWFNHYKLNNSKYDIINEPTDDKIKNYITANYKNYIKII
jgi:hypothetical protein